MSILYVRRVIENTQTKTKNICNKYFVTTEHYLWKTSKEYTQHEICKYTAQK